MRQQGFSYVVVMFLVAMLSVVSVRALESTQVAERQQKERELLWRGMAYRNAIRDYYLRGGGGYPTQLQQLLDDARFSKTQRHLRKLYRDPMTEDGEWGLILDSNGRLIGVHSLSRTRPLKRADFPLEMAVKQDAEHYSDWKFVYELPH